MTAEGQNFHVFGGDSRIINVTVKDGAGDIVNIAGVALALRIFKSSNNEDAEVSKFVGDGITITDAPNGEFQIILNPQDTNIVASGQLPYECRLTDTSGHVTTIMTGQMVVK